jgi:hypothetical protein
MIANVKKWGNSYAVRLSKRELKARGIRAGDEVEIEVRKRTPGKVDLSHLRTFHDPDPLASEHLDEYLYGE